MEKLVRYLGDRLMGRAWFHSAKATTLFTESARLTPALAVQATAPPRFWGTPVNACDCFSEQAGLSSGLLWIRTVQSLMGTNDKLPYFAIRLLLDRMMAVKGPAKPVDCM
jgi:hypothetical protein